MSRVVLGLIVICSMVYSAYSKGISRKCLNCICQVESNCRKKVGCHNDGGSLSCGPYQIKKAYWIDCGRPGSGYKSCAKNKKCAEKCVRKYMARYAAQCHSPPTCQTYARVHNGGPNGCQMQATLPYWYKVRRCLRRQG